MPVPSFIQPVRNAPLPRGPAALGARLTSRSAWFSRTRSLSKSVKPTHFQGCCAPPRGQAALPCLRYGSSPMRAGASVIDQEKAPAPAKYPPRAAKGSADQEDASCWCFTSIARCATRRRRSARRFQRCPRAAVTAQPGLWLGLVLRLPLSTYGRQYRSPRTLGAGRPDQEMPGNTNRHK